MIRVTRGWSKCDKFRTIYCDIHRNLKHYFEIFICFTRKRKFAWYFGSYLLCLSVNVTGVNFPRIESYFMSTIINIGFFFSAFLSNARAMKRLRIQWFTFLWKQITLFNFKTLVFAWPRHQMVLVAAIFQFSSSRSVVLSIEIIFLEFEWNKLHDITWKTVPDIPFTQWKLNEHCEKWFYFVTFKNGKHFQFNWSLNKPAICSNMGEIRRWRAKRRICIKTYVHSWSWSHQKEPICSHPRYKFPKTIARIVGISFIQKISVLWLCW